MDRIPSYGLIIGATSGIGKSLYSHYVADGCNVAIMGRRKNLLEEISSGNPSTTLPLSVDISDCKAFERAFKEVIERFQQIDLAIICASIGDLNPSLEISQELDTLATNIVGWTNVIDTLYNYFEEQGQGHIVSITSIGGMHPLRHHTVQVKHFKSTTQSLYRQKQRSRSCASQKLGRG